MSKKQNKLAKFKFLPFSDHKRDSYTGGGQGCGLRKTISLSQMVRFVQVRQYPV